MSPRKVGVAPKTKLDVATGLTLGKGWRVVAPGKKKAPCNSDEDVQEWEEDIGRFPHSTGYALTGDGVFSGRAVSPACSKRT